MKITISRIHMCRLDVEDSNPSTPSLSKG